MVDDSQATAAPTTVKSDNGQHNGSIVELSSLFRLESSLFRSEADVEEAGELLAERERKRRLRPHRRGRRGGGVDDRETGGDEDEEYADDGEADIEDGGEGFIERRRGNKRRGGPRPANADENVGAAGGEEDGRHREEGEKSDASPDAASSAEGDDDDIVRATVANDDEGDEAARPRSIDANERGGGIDATRESWILGGWKRGLKRRLFRFFLLYYRASSSSSDATSSSSEGGAGTRAAVGDVDDEGAVPRRRTSVEGEGDDEMSWDDLIGRIMGGGRVRPMLEDANASFFAPSNRGGGEGTSVLDSIREEGGSDEEDDDPIMEVMDFLEDEIDDHAYNDLIPLQIRMALEDHVFGWDHFLSNILGHVAFTVGSYLLTYWIITFAVLHEVPWGGNIYDDDIESDDRPWGIPHVLFSLARVALSTGSAASTFRAVRRRRHVWLRRPRGGDGPRRSSLEEADRRARRFVLGSRLWSNMQRSYRRRRNRHLANGVNRKLRYAEERFERRRRRNSHTLPKFAMESVSHDQMPFAHGEIKKIPYVHGGFFGAAPFMLTNPHWIGILRILMPDVYVEISRRASYAPSPKLIHWAENNPVVAAYGTAHEIEFSGEVPTLEWDVFLDPYLVRRVEIALSEKEAFLQRQKDGCGKSVGSRTEENETNNGGAVSESTPINEENERLILSYYDKEIKRRTTILTERMLIAHGNFVQLGLEQIFSLYSVKKYNFSRVKRTRKTLGGGIYARQWLAVYSEAIKLGMGNDLDDDDDDNIERDEVSVSESDNSLEDREDFDFANFSDMKEVAIISSDDDDADDRISIDGSEPSLARSEGSGTQKIGSSSKRKGHHQRRTANTVPAVHQVDATSLNKASACPDKSIAESISNLERIMHCSAPFGIVLDMKSRHVSRRVWALVIDLLRDAGARVEGIASFFVEEVRDITQYCSSDINEIVFLHSAGELQQKCHNGEIRRGDRVFFNAGSLLWEYPNMYDPHVVKNILWNRLHPCFDAQRVKERYRFKPFAKIDNSSRASPGRKQTPPDFESETHCDESALDDGDSTSSDLFEQLLIPNNKKLSSEIDIVYEKAPGGFCSTIQQYKEFYNISIGLYVQEFAIDEVAISLMVEYVNSNLHVYDLGLSWGGINGLTVKGIQPGRFTSTDGLWNQRYGGIPWKKELIPSFSSNRG